jgi:curved DNA-binding protein CbpA
MDRSEARRLLGVSPGASPRAVASAFRTRVRVSHPDRFPPGSEAAEDAAVVMRQLTDARRVLIGDPQPTQQPGVTGSRAEHGAPYVTREAAPGASERFRSAADIDRLARSWGLWWGSFLVVAAVASFIIGSRSATNDAVPIWSPALALIGLVSLIIGWRAHRRLR